MKLPKKGSVVWLHRAGEPHDVVRLKVCRTEDHRKAEGEAMAEWSRDPAVANNESLRLMFALIDWVPFGVLRNGGAL